jgi:hypothetical protein
VMMFYCVVNYLVSTAHGKRKLNLVSKLLSNFLGKRIS